MNLFFFFKKIKNYFRVIPVEEDEESLEPICMYGIKIINK